MAFFAIINELLRDGHRNLEFHIVHLLEPAPHTQTGTAHLQTTELCILMVKVPRNYHVVKSPPPPPPPGGVGGEGGV